jgi:hypothetical protein
MKYNQPYGVSDPNAPYINGNPSTGTMGSIPPAASIEFPQREIVNLITDVSIVPDNADLHQLAKGIQGGKLSFGPEIGSLADFHLTFTPTLLAYVDGMMVRFRALRDAPGPCALRIDALPQKALVKRGGSPIQPYDFGNGDMLECVYDALNNRFMVLGLQPVSSLHAALDYYINFATGNDITNDGLTAISPFKTINRAINGALSFNQNGYAVNIHCADGASFDQVNCPAINGTGRINIYGNVSNPAACTITRNGGAASGSCFVVVGPQYYISGFKLSSLVATPDDPGFGIWSAGDGATGSGALHFGPCLGGCMVVSGGHIDADGPFNVSGASGCFTNSDGGFLILNNLHPPTIALAAGASFTSAFAIAGRGGVNSTRFSGITGTATGKKYLATGNGVVDSGGQSVSFYPGDVAGTFATGGQYV